MGCKVTRPLQLRAKALQGISTRRAMPQKPLEERNAQSRGPGTVHYRTIPLNSLAQATQKQY
jgi:hypothetical protein